jgi:hypothetical protein
MKRAVGILCAGLLVGAAGCAWNFGNTRVEADVRVNDQAVDLALEDAAAKVQKELQKRGLEVTVHPEGDAIRLVSKTKAGGEFTVVLSRVRLASGKEQTRVRVEWGSSPDRELWLGLLVTLGASAVEAGR